MKRFIAVTVIILFVVSVSSCTVQPTATPIPTVCVTTTPAAVTTFPLITVAPTPFASETAVSPVPTESAVDDDGGDDGYMNEVPNYDIPDIAAAGLTNEQYQKIELLLFGAFGMYDDEGYRIYFDNVKEFNYKDYLSFTDRVMENGGTILGFEGSTLSISDIEKIVYSGFGVKYKAKNGDAIFDGYISVKNGYLELQGNGGDGRDCAYAYSIRRIGTDKLEVKYNIVFESDAGSEYVGKAQAILQEDKNSLFGYHLISVSRGKESNPKFTSSTSSSIQQPKGKKNFVPNNVIDGKGNTAWVTEKGKGEWIMLSSDTPQVITGLNIECGDWTNDDTIEHSGQPSKIRLDFSDGTSIETEGFESRYSCTVPCIAIGRAVKTTFVKITILEISESGPQENIYISEVAPF